MSNPTDALSPPNPVFPATVIKVIDENRIVINRGSKYILVNQRFLIYHIADEELKDPDTGEPLGRVEIVRGTGTATHVQEKITTITSDRKAYPERRVVKKSPPSYLAEHIYGATEEETVLGPARTLPFDEPTLGDRAKPI